MTSIFCGTDYSKRLQVQTYDVTAFFDAGKGTARLSALLGNGWAAAKLLAWQERPYAPFPSFIAEMTVLYRDGTKEIFGTDESWEVWTSGILSSEIYLGEEQDATVTPVRRGRAELSSVNTKLIAQEGENIVEGEIVRPRALIVTPKSEKVIDFGQNLAGYVRVRCKGPRGSKISFVPAEILDKDGNFYNENYRNASSVCTYTLSGGEDDFKPVFGFQGFRYIRIDKYFSDEIDLSCFTAIAVHSDMKRTGKFVSGNEKINRLYSNIVWGQLSNYIDVPTDCPQCDERLGWTGDAQVFCRTAAINFDVHAFFRKWLHDLIADQHKNGGRMTTGFLGTPYLLHALSENGRDDVAYGLLLQEKAPSWLFSVNMGATTM